MSCVRTLSLHTWGREGRVTVNPPGPTHTSQHTHKEGWHNIGQDACTSILGPIVITILALTTLPSTKGLVDQTQHWSSQGTVHVSTHTDSKPPRNNNSDQAYTDQWIGLSWVHTHTNQHTHKMGWYNRDENASMSSPSPDGWQKGLTRRGEPHSGTFPNTKQRH